MQNKSQGRVIVLLGPTASGKSSLAMGLAKNFGLSIVNCDSRQIYQKMDIGTAKPEPADQSSVVHHLLDIIPPSKPFDGRSWSDAAAICIRNIWDQNITPIIVGGTGFFFEALYRGLPEVTSAPGLRDELQTMLAEHGLSYLVDKLRELDPTSLELIDTQNSRRVLRALEMVSTEGVPLSEILSSRKPFPAKWCIFVVTQPREILHQRIEARVEEMFKRGLQTEVTNLWQEFGEHAPGLNAIGYREWLPFFRGEISLEKVKEKIIIHTRQYAKRQETWFKRRPGGEIRNIMHSTAIKKIYTEITEFLET